MIAVRQQLAGLRTRVGSDHPTMLYNQVRALTDQATCLLDEAPVDRHPTINRLVVECEQLLQRLAQ